MSEQITSATPAAAPAPSAIPSSPVSSTPSPEVSTPSTPDTNTGDTANTELSLDEKIAESLEGLDTPQEPQTEAQVQQELDDLDREFGIKDRSARNRIAYEKVRAKLEEKQAQLKAQLQQEHEQTLAQRQQEYAESFGKYQVTEQIMQQDPVRFLTTLAELDPQYRQLLAPLFQQPQQQYDPYADMPQPDVDLGNGRRTYSQEGIERRMAWERQQAVQEARNQMMQEFAPLMEMQQQHQRQQQEQAVIYTAHERTARQLEDAKTWPGFAENYDGILAELKADPKATLDSAYRKTVYGKLTADKNRIRQEIMAEMAQVPQSTSVSPSQPTPRQDTGDSLDDKIARAISKLG